MATGFGLFVLLLMLSLLLLLPSVLLLGIDYWLYQSFDQRVCALALLVLLLCSIAVFALWL